jgi:hypothetical protein
MKGLPVPDEISYRPLRDLYCHVLTSIGLRYACDLVRSHFDIQGNAIQNDKILFLINRLI